MNGNFTFGIIGGKGEMGNSLKNFLLRNNCKVYISDYNTELSNEQLVLLSDIVVLSVPLNNYEDVLIEISPYLNENPKKLLIDLGSLKMKQLELMKKYHKGLTMGTHPLFGPHKNFRESGTIIFCDTIEKENNKIQFLLKLFKKNGLKIINMTAAEHDELMSYIHSFYYLTNISYLKLLHEKFGKIDEIKEITTTSLQNFINNLNNIFNTPPWLIEQIIFDNPFFKERLNDFTKLLKNMENERKNLIEEVKGFAGYN